MMLTSNTLNMFKGRGTSPYKQAGGPLYVVQTFHKWSKCTLYVVFGGMVYPPSRWGRSIKHLYEFVRDSSTPNYN